MRKDLRRIHDYLVGVLAKPVEGRDLRLVDDDGVAHYAYWPTGREGVFQIGLLRSGTYQLEMLQDNGDWHGITNRYRVPEPMSFTTGDTERLIKRAREGRGPEPATPDSRP